ncbi:MAG: hypothetical protein ABS76_00065 [Pelagibacterium sp. SCN 64-44]|nr:MAG: hypothetical protein ABS76_00065 [Pelagibacterium sp. SCN 64-44]
MSLFTSNYRRLCQDIDEDNSRKNKYLSDAHKNYQKSRDQFGHLSRSSAKYLYANNGYARKKFSGLVFDAFEALSLEKDAYQLTLTPRQGMRREEEAVAFRPAQLKRLVSQRFRSLNMLGIMEAAFYPNVKDGLQKGLVCFHIHAIVWGVSRTEVDRLASAFRGDHPSFFEKRPSAYLQDIPVSDVPAVLRYQLKPPSIGYDVALTRIEEFATGTGEVVVRYITKSGQRKRELRMGERVRIDNCLRELTFDQLLVSTGDGRSMAEGICLRALAEYRRSQNRKP